MLCSYCDAPMPEVSAFCPACGRSTSSDVFEKHDLRSPILGAVAYVGLVPAIVFLLIPALRESRFLRFHSWQSILFTLASIVLGLIFRLLYAIFSVFPVFGLLIAWLVAGVGSLGLFTLWLVLVVKAAQGQKLELPVLGPLALRIAERKSV